MDGYWRPMLGKMGCSIIDGDSRESLGEHLSCKVTAGSFIEIKSLGQALMAALWAALEINRKKTPSTPKETTKR